MCEVNGFRGKGNSLPQLPWALHLPQSGSSGASPGATSASPSGSGRVTGRPPAWLSHRPSYHPWRDRELKGWRELGRGFAPLLTNSGWLESSERPLPRLGMLTSKGGRRGNGGLGTLSGRKGREERPVGRGKKPSAT